MSELLIWIQTTVLLLGLVSQVLPLIRDYRKT